MKTEYTSVEMEIIIFETDDVIISSCIGADSCQDDYACKFDTETELIPAN
ncbi:hypothetical protein SAMN02910317_02979 [Ruminococcaceae bacterium FB2012]|nr:hypothetical protein SAMN02910317_02979 [Ruminococcaceae bacterium FB2012]